MAILLALLLPLDLVFPTRLPGAMPRDLAGGVEGVALRLHAPGRVRPGAQVRLELEHTNVGTIPIRLVDDDCDQLTHFVQIDRVEYPVRLGGAACEKSTRLLAPGESFSTFTLIETSAAPFRDLSAGAAAGCGWHRLAGSYRANAFLRDGDVWAGALDALPLELEVVCP
jgi:hypothetical protein